MAKDEKSKIRHRTIENALMHGDRFACKTVEDVIVMADKLTKYIADGTVPGEPLMDPDERFVRKP